MNDKIEDLGDIQFNQVKHKRKKHRKKHPFIILFVFIGVLVVLYLFLSSSYFTVKKVTVKGNSYYTKDEVKSIADSKTGQNLFFGSGIGSMKERLKKEPYFKEISVKRKLPDCITIRVKERKQAAAIAYGKEYIVIDNSGTVLRKTDVMPEIPLLTGLTVSKLETGEKVEAEEKDILNKTLKMLEVMKNGNLFFKKIDFSKMVVRAYIYDDLVVKGTPGEIKKVIDSGNLQKLISSLMEDDIKRGTISVGGDDYISFSPELE